MSRPIEDQVRDLLAERTADVVPPAGWEERIAVAGRRRLVRRRAGVIATALAVVVLGVAAVGTNLPQALRGIEPAGPSFLRRGAPTDHLHATSMGDGPTTVRGATPWRTNGYVQQLLRVDDGFLVHATTNEDRLIHRRADGSQRVLRSGETFLDVTVSADGKHAAWFEVTSDQSKGLGDLNLVELSSGRTLESMPVRFSDPPMPSTPRVMDFIGDRVVLSYYEGFQSPYVWDPAKQGLSPLLGPSYAGNQGRLLDLTEDTVLLMGSKGCMRNLRPADPRPVERWKVCGFGAWEEVRISPDGSWFAGYQPEGEAVWVRDLDTGRLVWQQVVVPGKRLRQLEWESPGHVLVTYGTAGDLDAELGDLLRCAASRPTCERVPTANGERVVRLAD